MREQSPGPHRLPHRVVHAFGNAPRAISTRFAVEKSTLCEPPHTHARTSALDPRQTKKEEVSDANPTRRISRPWLAMGSRRHQSDGLLDGGPPARPGLTQRAGVRPRFTSSSNGL